MKKIVLASAVLASVAAVATAVESSNTFGVMKITDSVTRELVIGVPWAAVSSANNDAINAMNLVLPTADDDQLYWYDKTDKKYYVWTVKNGAWAVDTTTELSDGNETGSAEKTLARGDAVILFRKTPATNSDIYLSGQVATAGTPSSTILAPTAAELARLSTSVAYTLIANPNPSADADLNIAERFYSDEGLKTAVDYKANDLDNDKIVLSNGTTYGHDSTRGWYKWTGGGAKGGGFIPNQKTYTGVTIPAGQGAWYVRNGDSTLYIKW